MYVIILAAGRGSRLGGTVPKALAEIAQWFEELRPVLVAPTAEFMEAS